MQFSPAPNWTDRFPTGFYQVGKAHHSKPVVTDYKHGQNMVHDVLSQGNTQNIVVPRLNPNAPKPPKTSIVANSEEGFMVPPSTQLIMRQFISGLCIGLIIGLIISLFMRKRR